MLDIWDEKLAGLGARIMKARIIAVEQLGPHVARAYADVAPGEGACDISYSTATLVSRETRPENPRKIEAPAGATDAATGTVDPESSTPAQGAETEFRAPRPSAAGDATERVAPTPLTSVDELARGATAAHA